jgi:DNA-binding response OmpR family regulator
VKPALPIFTVMATAGPALPQQCIDPLVHRLGEQERSVLGVLIANRGRVVGRRELARRAGLANLSERRCDSLLVAIRRVLGKESLVTVRSRGWMLNEEAIAAAEAVARGEQQ